MREETTSRVTAADRPYGEFYDFYSVRLENIGSTLVISKLTERSRIVQLMLGHVADSGERDHGPSYSIERKNSLNSQGSIASQEQFYSADIVT